MARILLFTQCLQNDFVAPIPEGARIPNQLHIGRAESQRLVGDSPREGPLGRFLRAFYAGATQDHAVVHIRDWHDSNDPAQRHHLAHFGPHCLKGTPGAAFVPPLDDLHDDGVATIFVDSAVLNDFEGTDLAARIRSLLGTTPASDAVAGIIGVWTDVKVQYLAYDLLTRVGIQNIVLCSALAASRSRVRHFQALDLMSQNLGVRVIDGIPEFLGALGIGKRPEALASATYGVRLEGLPLAGEDAELVKHLFRDCRSVDVAALSGGFSGARVYRTRSVDQEGRTEVPFVVKVDSLAKIGRERAAVERVENILGSSAPAMSDFADLHTRGAIKYFYASMHHSPVATLQQRLKAARTPAEMETLFRRVWESILSRLSQAPIRDRVQVWQHYMFRPEYAQHTLDRAAELAEGIDLSGLRRFYDGLPARLAEDPVDSPVCWVHGDLNLANVLLDDAGNSWLIDYFHTGPGHALKDAAKLENDLKFIMLPIRDEAALARAGRWEDLLLAPQSLAHLPEPLPPDLAADPDLCRIDAAVRVVRSWARELCSGIDDVEPYRIALLRYSAHTLGFDEPDRMQRRHALAATIKTAEKLSTNLSAVRVDSPSGASVEF